jgi:hypothetical protein
LILMDLQMPGGSGLVAIRAIIAANPNARILVVTLFEDDDSVFTALRSGARGYILKDADEAEMVRALRAVANGEAIFSPAIATRVMRFLAHPPAAVPREAFPSLTEREREILVRIAQGHNNGAIALALSPAPRRSVSISSPVQVPTGRRLLCGTRPAWAVASGGGKWEGVMETGPHSGGKFGDEHLLERVARWSSLTITGGVWRGVRHRGRPNLAARCELGNLQCALHITGMATCWRSLGVPNLLAGLWN